MPDRAQIILIAGGNMGYQTPRTHRPDRKDHIWYRKPNEVRRTFKCILCGAITHDQPPEHPTDYNWRAETYEPLDEVERNLAPFEVSRR
jgi:hypothetical protein